MISSIYKHKPSKHNELRYQINKHEIAEKLVYSRQQKIKPLLLKIHPVVQVRVDPTESI
jgi:hypothetical protein